MTVSITFKGCYIRLFEHSIRSQIIEIMPFSPKHQVVIEKTQYSSLLRPLFQTVMVSINFYSTIYWNTKQLYQLKYSNKNQINLKQNFSTESIHALLSKDQKNKFPRYIVGIAMVSISLLDENIKILEI